MKPLIILIFLFCSSGLYAQYNKMKKIDIFLKETEALVSTKKLLAGIISQKSRKKQNAPKNIEETIQASIDYESYIDEVQEAYVATYTEDQIDELLKIYRSGDMEYYKKKTESVSKKLYEIGTAFGKESVALINEKLKTY